MRSTKPLGPVSFIALIAALMAQSSLAIDTMLPTLPQIARALNVSDASDAQWVVTAYVLGLGCAQLFYGSLADRYGRRPILLIGIGVYILFSVLAGFTTSLPQMIAARFLQGVGAAASQVLAISMVRDRFSGREMARIMSITLLVFLSAPIVAPSIGALIVMFAPWPWLFYALALFGVVIFLRVWAMPETLHPEDRLPLSPRAILGAVRVVLSKRVCVGYMLATTCLIGALLGFINSVQQIFAQTFGMEKEFPVAFAAIAGGVAASSLLNARIVSRLGSRKVSHTALLAYIAIGAIHCAIALSGQETVWMFIALQSATMFCFGLIASNFGAMAMEPLGHVAGTGSSVQGFVTNLGGAAIGFVIGGAFDGTPAPLAIGFAVGGVAALGFVLVAEGGRLFVSREAISQRL